MKASRHDTRYLQLILLALGAIVFTGYVLTTKVKLSSSPLSSSQLESRVTALEQRQNELETIVQRIHLTSSTNFTSSSSPPKSSPSTKAGVHAVANTSNTVHPCFRWEKEWGVFVGHSWGTATQEQQDLWKKNHCDKVIQEPFPRPERTPMPQDYDYAPASNIIAICFGATTRKVKSPSIENLSLFKNLFPSLQKTLEKGFVYRVYLGYDVGDQFFDAAGQTTTIHRWFDELFGARRRQGFNVSLHLHRLHNEVPKPGPIFNALLKIASDEGAHFFYRVNDDSVFLSPWATALRDFLIGFGPPYGVVGPWCAQGNSGILTHDFVHRTHMDIFEGVYYPPVFSDWYMDDWISRVYGRSRTRRLRHVQVEHRTSAHGQRYSVDYEHRLHLQAEINNGRDKIARWMKNHGLARSLIDQFVNDSRTFTVGDG